MPVLLQGAVTYAVHVIMPKTLFFYVCRDANWGQLECGRTRRSRTISVYEMKLKCCICCVLTITFKCELLKLAELVISQSSRWLPIQGIPEANSGLHQMM